MLPSKFCGGIHVWSVVKLALVLSVEAVKEARSPVHECVHSNLNGWLFSSRDSIWTCLVKIFINSLPSGLCRWACLPCVSDWDLFCFGWQCILHFRYKFMDQLHLFLIPNRQEVCWVVYRCWKLHCLLTPGSSPGKNRHTLSSYATSIWSIHAPIHFFRCEILRAYTARASNRLETD